MGHPRDRKWQFQNAAAPQGPLTEGRLYCSKQPVLQCTLSRDQKWQFQNATAPQGPLTEG